MPRLRPVSRVELIRNLRQLGFEGPFAGGNHGFMLGRGRRLTLANHHASTIGRDVLAPILCQVGVGRGEWEGLGLVWRAQPHTTKGVRDATRCS